MAGSGTLLGEVQRAARRFWGLRWFVKWPIIVFLGLVILAAILPSGDDQSDSTASRDESEDAAEESSAKPTATTKSEKPTNTRQSTNTPAPPTATPTPLPPTPTPTPITLSGSGQSATSPVTIPVGIWIARFNYTGSSNFIVKAFNSKGRSDLLVNEIGRYSGSHALTGPETYQFDIQASGSWTVTIQPIGVQPNASISDHGDSVSGAFPHGGGPKTFAIAHTGKSNFIVHLQCDKGAVSVQNEIGPVSGSRIVNFPSGTTLCFWEVQADGDWSLIEQ